MIKINVLKSISNKKRNKYEVDDHLQSAEVLDSEDLSVIQRIAFKNVAIFFLLGGSVVAYEKYHLSELKRKYNLLYLELNELQQKNKEIEDLVLKNKKLEDQQKDLQDQINEIENLKKDRNRILKILELIQKNIPLNFWIDDFSFDQNEIYIKGYSVSNSDVTDFLEVLSKNVYFKDVKLISSQDYKNEKFGLIKNVEIKCILETKL